jgi:NADPH-dependent curcumin reductase CurA
MTASLAHQIVLAVRPNGKPHLTDFQLEETEIPTPASEQLLLAVQYLSLGSRRGPAQRLRHP